MNEPKRYKTSYGFDAEAGMVINEQYELIEPIGSGSSCDVWSAHHLLGDFICALKFLNPSRIALSLGKDEFRLLAQIYHPNIIRTFDMGYVKGRTQPFMSMEYMSGKSFKQVIDEKESISPQCVFGWLDQLLSVLCYLRGMNIIHKDIKPANIMFEGDKAVLIDFNISLKDDPLIGTPIYKCPTVEQLGSWTPYADLWALALSFYELLAQREIFDYSTSFDPDLNDDCPKGFPENTFIALKDIIQGEGQNVEINQIKSLFKLDEPISNWTEIPETLCKEFNISSRNQKFLTLYLMNQLDSNIPQSKNVILAGALKEAGLPAGQEAMRRLRPVFSQLKTKGVIDYTGKGNQKVLFANVFSKKLMEKQL
jgi:serine/threonine protein kinase